MGRLASAYRCKTTPRNQKNSFAIFDKTQGTRNESSEDKIIGLPLSFCKPNAYFCKQEY